MPLCPSSKYTPTYDDQFFADIGRCPQSPSTAYCDCYELAALNSQIRAAEGETEANRQAMVAAQTAYNQAKLYPRMTEIPAPDLNVPSRANQKKNTYSKIFDPKIRKILVLLIASFLIYLAFVSYD
jgi:hypothetical protein